MFGEMYAEQEHPSPATLKRERAEAARYKERRDLGGIEKGDAAARARTRARIRMMAEQEKAERKAEEEKVAQFKRDVATLRPTHWDEETHTPFFRQTWVSLVDAWQRKHAGVTEVKGEDSGQIIDLVSEAEDALRVEFPVLGQGRVRVRALWLEYVLGREGILAFCDEEATQQLEELVTIEARRLRGSVEAQEE